MNKQLILGLLIGAILGIALAPVLSGWGGYGWRMPMVGFRGNYGSGMGNIDAHFIEQMIPHHDDAIAMARLALEKSQRNEIRSLAGGIIEAQERENADMRRWYEEWFKTSVPEISGYGMMRMGRGMGMGGRTDLDLLKNASDFDRAFIEEMIPHHAMAIMMARMLQVSTARSEMQTLADQIITSQSREITMMESWYGAWY